jgi:hypothetical protein
MAARSQPLDSTECHAGKGGDVEVVGVELNPRVTLLGDRDRGPNRQSVGPPGNCHQQKQPNVSKARLCTVVGVEMAAALISLVRGGKWRACSVFSARCQIPGAPCKQPCIANLVD